MKRAPPQRGKGISGPEFSKLISPLGPFEDRPHLAVAVSGGADSMALCVLAQRWTAKRHATLTAITVDHGLRPGAAAEARQVAAWCRARGIAHVTLRWQGDKPTTGIQAAARVARYGLLEAWCAHHAVLHLLIAHHRDDQAETVALRRERGSGADGLAGMAAIVETPKLRILRPLLAVPKSRLAATLTHARQNWIEDPSNVDPRFARARLRAAKAARRPSASAGRQRALREAAAAKLLASAWVHPTGWAEVDARKLAAARPELARAALSRLLMCIGGTTYPPATEKLDRLRAALAAGGLSAARTLAFCRVVERDGRLIVARETGRAPARRVQIPLAPARFAAVKAWFSRVG